MNHIKLYDRDGFLIFGSKKAEYARLKLRDFDSLQLQKANFVGFELEGAVFSDANVSGSDFSNADLYWASFYRAIADSAVFDGACLRGANLTLTSFVAASFRAADLSQDALGGSTDLQGANLLDAIFTDAKLDGALYDEKTLFPKNFDPRTSGMVAAGS